MSSKAGEFMFPFKQYNNSCPIKVPLTVRDCIIIETCVRDHAYEYFDAEDWKEAERVADYFEKIIKIFKSNGILRDGDPSEDTK